MDHNKPIFKFELTESDKLCFICTVPGGCNPNHSNCAIENARKSSAPSPPVTESILRHLADNPEPQTTKQIAIACGLKHHSVSAAMTRLQRSGRVLPALGSSGRPKRYIPVLSEVGA